MPHLNDDTSDFEKLKNAFHTLTGHVSSVDDFLAAFGLINMPSAQRYGIMFGFIVFILTICAVVTLLVLGGSFSRMAEQLQTGEVTVPDPVSARSKRSLLLEHLLESRDRMVKENYPPPKTTTEITKLMAMILNVPIRSGNVAELTDESEEKRVTQSRFIPPGYQKDYVEAYKACQDKPGGPTMSGLPEARFEAYARAFASTGPHVHRDYRRSYGRLYESFSCQSHGTEEKFRNLYTDRPADLVGRLVRLEALEVDRHVEDLYDGTCGLAHWGSKQFDPKEVWGFLGYGPFKDKEEMAASPIFHRKLNEAGFAIIENVTDRILGVILLSNDNPQHLTVSMDPPIVRPSAEGTAEPIEACFLILDKLFALGYRRVQMSVDSEDAVHKKTAARLGFTKEAEIPKHMIVKESNRDSTIYGMLNSDWSKGCRSFLFQKLHGTKMDKYDKANNTKEGEQDEQLFKLAERKAMEAAAANAKNKKV